MLAAGPWKYIVADGAFVEAGDTLAVEIYRLFDPVATALAPLLDDTSGLDHGAHIRGLLADTPSTLPDSLIALMRRTDTELRSRRVPSPATTEPVREPPTVRLSAEQVELAAAELLGAQHAIADARAALERVTPPRGVREAAAVDSLLARIAERERFVHATRIRMYGVPQPVRSPSVAATAVVPAEQHLDERQQARFVAFAKTFPSPRRGVRAPVAGRFRAAPVGTIPYIETLQQKPAHAAPAGTGGIGELAPGHERRTGPPSTTQAAYYLRGRGLPHLWARADRLEATDTVRASAGTWLEIVHRE